MCDVSDVLACEAPAAGPQTLHVLLHIEPGYLKLKVSQVCRRGVHLTTEIVFHIGLMFCPETTNNI